MIPYGALHPTDGIPKPPDTIQTLLLAAATPQALDLPSTLAQIVRLTAMSTLGIPIGVCVSLNSTRATAPSSGLSTGSGNSLPNFTVMGEKTLQIPSGSTGWSAGSAVAGYLTAEFWRL